MTDQADLDQKKQRAREWFKDLRDQICASFEEIDGAKFERKTWQRAEGGGGEISMMRGNVFEKVGVNISTVWGEFSEQFRKEIPGAEENPNFWASGISIVAHLKSPCIPPVHMNTRMIVTTKSWFGGGTDLNPCIEVAEDTAAFHLALKETCDRHDPEYYPKFKQWADEYFFIKHRNEARGVGGIFYDYLNSGNFENDFDFTKDVGRTFLDIYPQLVRKNLNKSWTEADKKIQLEKRGRYVEFNLVYDRGTRFGLMTGGNTEAILMSLPPEAAWK